MYDLPLLLRLRQLYLYPAMGEHCALTQRAPANNVAGTLHLIKIYSDVLLHLGSGRRGGRFEADIDSGVFTDCERAVKQLIVASDFVV